MHISKKKFHFAFIVISPQNLAWSFDRLLWRMDAAEKKLDFIMIAHDRFLKNTLSAVDHKFHFGRKLFSPVTSQQQMRSDLFWVFWTFDTRYTLYTILYVHSRRPDFVCTINFPLKCRTDKSEIEFSIDFDTQHQHQLQSELTLKAFSGEWLLPTLIERQSSYWRNTASEMWLRKHLCIERRRRWDC